MSNFAIKNILLPHNVVMAILKAADKSNSKILNIYKAKIVNYVFYIADFKDYVLFVSKDGSVLLDVLKIEFQNLLDELNCLKEIYENSVKIIGIDTTAHGSVKNIINCFTQNNFNFKEDLAV
jgi:biopolymer transport protein ExbD